MGTFIFPSNNTWPRWTPQHLVTSYWCNTPLIGLVTTCKCTHTQTRTHTHYSLVYQDNLLSVELKWTIYIPNWRAVYEECEYVHSFELYWTLNLNLTFYIVCQRHVELGTRALFFPFTSNHASKSKLDSAFCALFYNIRTIHVRLMVHEPLGTQG